ncbi:hypothetical protein Tco_1064170 [Tanacetum coccineum]
MNERCSTVLLNKLPSKEKDPGSFTIPYDIGQLHMDNALADLGANISLMPYTMYEKLGLDFVILDIPEDSRVPIILGRPFLATARAMIDVFNKKITLRVGDDEVIFEVDQSIKRPPTKDDECYGIDDLDDTIIAEAQELLANDEPDSFLSRGLEKSIDQSDLEDCEPVQCNNNNGSNKPIRHIASINTSYSVDRKRVEPVEVEREHIYSASANEIDEKKPELKDFPHHLEYAYLHDDKSFPIIISSELSEREKISLLQVLEKRKGEITWKMLDIKGISLYKQDSNGGRLQTGHSTPKAFKPERFFQILIAPEDEEKTTFTCPYGTFAYRRTPFRLCNAPATFQRCMTAICHDMVEDFMEVFMDDFSAFGIEVDRAKIDVIAKLP